MFISKTVISLSSDTANWTGKKIGQSCDLNGELFQIVLPSHSSTAKALRFYRGSTNAGQRVALAARSTSQRPISPRLRFTGDSSGSFTFASSATRIPWPFAEQKLIVMGATQSGGNVMIYMAGTVGSSGG